MDNIKQGTRVVKAGLRPHAVNKRTGDEGEHAIICRKGIT